MAQSNHERVGKALELLNGGLKPFVEREMLAKYGPRWHYEAVKSLREQHLSGDDEEMHLDTQGLMLILWDQWNMVFNKVLGHSERSIVSELRETRNQWAHQKPFSSDDTYRALDSMQRLLTAVSATQQAAGVSRPPQAQRAVLVGYELSPAQPRDKPDGCIVRTLWGELAWQLLGRDGFAMVAEADRQGVSPGSEILRELFTAAAPCLILIDEWVVYARQLYDVSALPGGSFDANLSFAQALTEAAKAAPQTLVVATIPASDTETGGEGGREAAVRLKNIFARIESPWRPADTEEGFEIVRRRLFQNITEPALFIARDSVAKGFMDLYRSQPQDFPANSREAEYERRIKAAYPIHPELFDRLYNDWSSIEKFQRTRGVLRLMAAVVHALWERQDTSPLILPAHVPIDESSVQAELTRYLEDNWMPVIEKDIDGPHSLPLHIDGENANLGRYSASRRVARTIYLGSAPNPRNANRGLAETQIKLGCVQPGENVAIFGDALRRLSDQSTHLSLDGQRYWYDTRPTVARLAQDRAAQLDEESVLEEIEKRLRVEQGTRGDFARVHVSPTSGADIAEDDTSARLVILKPQFTHALRDQQSKAREVANTILDLRGNTRRGYRNMLVFLAAGPRSAGPSPARRVAGIAFATTASKFSGDQCQSQAQN